MPPQLPVADSNGEWLGRPPPSPYLALAIFFSKSLFPVPDTYSSLCAFAINDDGSHTLCSVPPPFKLSAFATVPYPQLFPSSCLLPSPSSSWRVKIGMAATASLARYGFQCNSVNVRWASGQVLGIHDSAIFWGRGLGLGSQVLVNFTPGVIRLPPGVVVLSPSAVNVRYANEISDAHARCRRRQPHFLPVALMNIHSVIVCPPSRSTSLPWLQYFVSLRIRSTILRRTRHMA